MINPQRSAWVESGELGVRHRPMQLVPCPAVNSEQPLPGSFLQGKEGGEVVGSDGS